MKCEMCGTELEKDSTVCPKCHHDNLEEEVEVLSDSRIDNDIKDTSKDELLEMYMGNEYDIVRKQPFNIWAFLFKWFYLLYKELYITGMIGLFIFWIFIVILPKYLLLYLSFSTFFWGFFFNRYYLFVTWKKLELLKKKEESYDIITDRFKKRWVKFIPFSIISCIFIIVVVIGLDLIPKTKNYGTYYWEKSTENLANCLSITKSSYMSTKKHENIGEIVDAVCRVKKSDILEYEVILKTDVDNELIYSLFEAKDGNVIYKKSTFQLNDFIIRESEGTLKEEEEEELIELREIQSSYQDIYNESKREDDLLDKEKKLNEKKNYILLKNEILR